MSIKLPHTVKAPDRTAYSLYQMLETGLVFHINREYLHPQGLALAIDCGPDSEAGGWSLHAAPEGESIEFDLPEGFAEQREATWAAIVALAREEGVAPEGGYAHLATPPDATHP